VLPDRGTGYAPLALRFAGPLYRRKTSMTDIPTRQAIAARNRSRPGQVSGKLRLAIEAMIWQAARRADAAKAAGMTDHSLRAALKKPHVKAALMRELQVLRESERPRNVFALVDVRDNSPNAMARVAAAKALEQIDNEAASARPESAVGPGLIFIIEPRSPAPEPLTIDIEPESDADE
jgi:hypothetical protein